MEQERIQETEISTQLEARPLEVITTEIIAYKQVAGQAIVEIGNRLMEAKAQLSHGEWLPWLEEQVQFSEVSAQRFMRLAKEYSNPSLVTDLGSSKALSLLALPPVERDEFVAQKHEVNGEEKTVYEMSKRELEQAIQKLKSKDKEIEELNSSVDRLSNEISKQSETISELNGQIAELQNREPEVQKVVDLDAQEELKKKISKLEKDKASAEAAKRKAETEKKAAEDNLASLRAQNAEGSKAHQAEITVLEQQNKELRKQLAVASSSEMSVYKIHFEQAQKSINEMISCIGRMRTAGDEETAGKATDALRALLDTCSKAVG